MKKRIIAAVLMFIAVFLTGSCSSTGMKMESPESAEMNVSDDPEKTPEKPSLPEQKVPEASAADTFEKKNKELTAAVKKTEKKELKPTEEKEKAVKKQRTRAVYEEPREEETEQAIPPVSGGTKENPEKRGGLWVLWFIIFIIIGLVILIFLVFFTREKKKDETENISPQGSEQLFNKGTEEKEPLSGGSEELKYGAPRPENIKPDAAKMEEVEAEKIEPEKIEPEKLEPE
ncbi:MAG: hypothetical protein ACLFP1_09300, partial [Candidatus Goldiibacteriota bacterium]